MFDAHVAGIPECLIGIESRVVPRQGWYPARRARTMDVGTRPAVLEEAARTISTPRAETRPLVVLANLPGFDGVPPESLRDVQLGTAPK